MNGSAQASAMAPPLLATYGTPGAGPGLLLKDDKALVRLWLGGAKLVECTVDDVRGLQKCCEVGDAREASLAKTRFLPSFLGARLRSPRGRRRG